MKATEKTQYSIAFLLQELLFDIVRFPFWWYTRGLMKVVRAWIREVRIALERLSVRIWLQNMFTPMYGDYTKSGRIISFFLRIFVLIWRLIGLILWSAFFGILVVLWVALPVLIVYAIIRQF